MSDCVCIFASFREKRQLIYVDINRSVGKATGKTLEKRHYFCDRWISEDLDSVVLYVKGDMEIAAEEYRGDLGGRRVFCGATAETRSFAVRFGRRGPALWLPGLPFAGPSFGPDAGPQPTGVAFCRAALWPGRRAAAYRRCVLPGRPLARPPPG